jgi:lysozyme family protein
MTQQSFEKALPRLIAHEGGYADHPRDPGGATKFGITRATLAAWRGGPVTKTDVRRLTQNQAAEIYKARYWDAVSADALPAGVDYCVFDAAVNSGPARAARWLQAAARVAQDGAIGPKTLAAVAALDRARLIDDICDVRLAFLRGLSTWAVFGRGWERRVEEVRNIARAMACEAVPPSTPATKPAGTGVWAGIAAFLRAILTGGKR